MKMPLPDLLDRYTIVKLKIERVGGKFLLKELHEYQKTIEIFRKSDVKIDQKWIKRLYEINAKIWDLEHPIRSGKESNMTLEEIGRICIKIRDLNIERISIKNEIVKKTGFGFLDTTVENRGE